MRKPSDEEERSAAQRAKIIGLGERSFRKSYYPELQRRLGELERFRALLDDSNDAIFLLERQSASVVDLNASACRQLGRARQELLGLSLLMLLPSPGREQFHALVVRESGRALLTTTLERRDGGLLPVELALRMVRFEQSEYVVAVARDVTERLRAEDELRRAKETAEAGDRAKGEFLSIASHELRTPLTSLQLLIKRCIMRLSQGESVELTDLTRMERRAERLARLINDLIDVTRLEHGRLMLDRTSVDLSALLTLVVDDFSLRMPRRQIALSLPWQVEVDADAVRVEQVVTNLIDNAGKYSPEQAPIELQVTVGDTEVTVAVTDHGPGIPEEQRPRLFSRFCPPHDVSHHQRGLGLGLFICDQLVRLHGGTMVIRSVIGGGSTFSFTLPLTSREI